MLLCVSCRLHGYCYRICTQLVTDDELENAQFIRDVRATALAESIDAAEWHEHVANLYRDYRGWVENSEAKSGTQQEVFLDMQVFEVASIREWFRDFCCTPCPDDVMPRVRCEARERVRVLATILRASYPLRASLWGSQTANDNRAPNQ